MSGRGIVDAEVFRTELIDANARTSDPTNPAVGNLWIRSDVQPSVSGATTVAALRIQGPGGVLEVPLFDSSEESNLGADVYVGERRRFDDGTVGFIAETDQGGSLGSPRLLAPDGTEYEAHDSLEVSAIPDPGLLHQWPVSTNSYPLTDTEGANDFSQGVGGSFDDTTETWKDGWGYVTDGSDYYAQAQSHVSETQFTVCWWVYPQAPATNTAAFVNGQNQEEYPQIRKGANGNWNLDIRDSGGSFYNVTGDSVVDNSLILISGRYDGSDLQLIENTTQTATTSVGSITKVNSSIAPTLGTRFSGGSPESGWEFDAIFDWGLYYNRALSDSEIQQIYDAHPATA